VSEEARPSGFDPPPETPGNPEGGSGRPVPDMGDGSDRPARRRQPSHRQGLSNGAKQARASDQGWRRISGVRVRCPLPRLDTGRSRSAGGVARRPAALERAPGLAPAPPQTRSCQGDTLPISPVPVNLAETVAVSTVMPIRLCIAVLSEVGTARPRPGSWPDRRSPGRWFCSGPTGDRCPSPDRGLDFMVCALLFGCDGPSTIQRWAIARHDRLPADQRLPHGTHEAPWVPGAAYAVTFTSWQPSART
jgi:hypothetical protein